jgi:hypothetical protein
MRTSNSLFYRTKQRALPSDHRRVESDSDSSNDDSSHHIPQIVNGLSESRFKQLLTDIEEAGGLNLFNFGRICKQKPEIYGLAGSAQQQQFRNKLRSIRGYSAEDYQLVLGEYKVRSCRIAARPQLVSPERTKDTSKAPTETAARKTPAIMLSTPSSRSRGRITSPPSSRGRVARRDSAANDFEDTFEDAIPKTANTCVIEVDVDHPSNNREVVIYFVPQVEHGNNLYDCFDIYVQTDVRDFMAERLNAMLHTQNEILITMPALPYAFCQATNARNDRLKKIEAHNGDTQRAQDITINNMERSGPDGFGFTKQLLLRFPSHIVLSNVLQGDEHKIIAPQLEMDQEEFRLNGAKGAAASCFVKWRIADLSGASRHKLAAARAPNVDQVAKQLAGMFPSS